MNNEIYDVAIIGGGPAGLSAALYCNREDIKTILFESMTLGGMINEASLVENYPGYPEGINGYDLSMKFTKQAEKFGLHTEYEEIQKVIKNNNTFELIGENNTYYAKTVIIATGSNKIKLNVPGEKKFSGKGVSYCATCDAPFFRNKIVCVIGGGNTALMEAEHLSKFASKVYLIHRRSEYKASSIVIKQIEQNDKIEQLLNYKVNEICGTDSVEKVIIENTTNKTIKELTTSAIFIAVGIHPKSELIQDLLQLSEDGSINTNINMETEIKGLFAIGDVRNNSIKQVISACGDGATAAIKAKKYI